MGEFLLFFQLILNIQPSTYGFFLELARHIFNLRNLQLTEFLAVEVS